MAWRTERTAVMRALRPVVVAGAGALGVAVARHDPTRVPTVVGVVAVVAVVAVLRRERAAAVAALGVGASAAFVPPDGLGPLLVTTGVVIACDVAAADHRLAPWRDVIDALIALPALAGLAGTVAAQPSQRAVALGATTAVVVAGSAWFGRPGGGHTRTARLATASPSTIGVVGAVAAVVVALAPDRLSPLGDLPWATLQAARGVAAGLAVFAFVVVVDVVRSHVRQLIRL